MAIAMSSHTWMMRRLTIDSIRNDREWNNGIYSVQPRSAWIPSAFYGIVTAGGTFGVPEIGIRVQGEE